MKTSKIDCRCSIEERSAIKEKADKRGVTMSTYLLSQAMNESNISTCDDKIKLARSLGVIAEIINLLEEECNGCSKKLISKLMEAETIWQ